MAQTITPKNAKPEQTKPSKVPTAPCKVLVSAVGAGVALRKGKVADVPVPLIADLVKVGYIEAPDDFEAEKAPSPSEQPKTGGVEKRAPSGKQSKAKGEETR